MASSFQLPEDLGPDFILILANGSPHAQPRITVDQGTAPEGSSLVFFWAPPFCPLWETKVHRASI